MTVGQYMEHYRKQRHLTLREMADRLDISAPYLSDLEKGNRQVPGEMTRLEKYVSIYGFNQQETIRFYDLVAEARDTLAPDIAQYLQTDQSARSLIRYANLHGVSEEVWKTMLEALKDKVGDNLRLCV